MKKHNVVGKVLLTLIIAGGVFTASIFGLRYYWVWCDSKQIKEDSKIVDNILEEEETNPSLKKTIWADPRKADNSAQEDIEAETESKFANETAGTESSVQTVTKEVGFSAEVQPFSKDERNLEYLTEGITEGEAVNTTSYEYASDVSAEARHVSAKIINTLREKYKNDEIYGYLVITGKRKNGKSFKIEYPIVQGETNDTYIHAGPDKNYLYQGSIFIDAGNNPDFTDTRTSVYGHNMKDGSMFGMLKQILEEDWTDKYFTIYCGKGILRYKIIGYGLINGAGGNFHLNPSKTIEKTYIERGLDEEKAKELSKEDYGWQEDMYRVYLNSIQWDPSFLPKLDPELLKKRDWSVSDKLAETEFENLLFEDMSEGETETEVDIIHGADINDTYEVSSYVKSIQDAQKSKVKDITRYEEDQLFVTEDDYITTLFTCYMKSGYRLTATGFLMLNSEDREEFETSTNSEIKSFTSKGEGMSESMTEAENSEFNINNVLGDVTETVNKLLGEEEEVDTELAEN